eukprot:CAMPEP_0174268738 /NCGR_PEP_ID=MMETSP0439-20130205/38496_1 /TAXON_ID=0 /ORGANISM="Stereomyxa ramosa, Strain Chinc5" /LENGTH=86 /DNA_ID=CAMNT_0015357097 /DNA_START=217 /DNA_END=474 /DNA_ORIENTATION=-
MQLLPQIPAPPPLPFDNNVNNVNNANSLRNSNTENPNNGNSNNNNSNNVNNGNNSDTDKGVDICKSFDEMINSFAVGEGEGTQMLE